MPAVKAAHRSNWKASRRQDFVTKMIAEIQRRRCEIVRISISGDFYSPDYVEKWVEIVRNCPTTVFFSYTRSWRLAAIRPALDRLAALPNMRLWWSVDSETGIPDDVPPRVRLAYMSVALIDEPAQPVDLVFRDYPIRGITQKRVAGAMVCPPENGVTKINCEKCGFCWRNRPSSRPAQASNRRWPLSVLTD